MDIKARNKLCNVLAVLTNKYPFYSFFAFSWKLTENPGLGTFATDMETLYYDPKTVMEWDQPDLLFAVVHEITHCIFLHPGSFGTKRSSSKNRQLWMLAAEYTVNSETKQILGLKNHELPKGILYSDMYHGKTTEQVYEMLQKEGTNLTTLNISIHSETVEATCDSCGTKIPSSALAAGKCPNCGKELPVLKNGFIDHHVAQEKKEKLQQAIERILVGGELAKAKGCLTAGIERQIGKLRNAQVPWERILHRLVSQVLSDDDYRWDAPNFRHPLSESYIIPGLRSEKAGDIAIAIDTSGSISEPELTAFTAEISKLHGLTDEITVLSCDCAVNEKVKTRNINEFCTKLRFKGGGGTSFVPVFEELKKSKPAPALLIYFTDGYGDFPDTPPQTYPVLWVLTENHNNPPWGHKSILKTGGQ